MGNRAVITTKEKKIGVYLHWNGGRDSVEAFLTYCKMKNYRTPESDNYGWARLCQVIGNCFGGECSIGVDREFYNGAEQNNHDLLKMLKDINKCQPEQEQFRDSDIEKYVNGEV